MKKTNYYLMLLILAVGLVPAALPQYDARAQGELVEVTLQPSGASMNDTYIDSAVPTGNYGTGTYVAVGERNDSSAVQRTLLKFDLTGLPNDMTVVSAELTLKVSADLSDNTRTMRAYPLLVPWVEEATWDKRNSATNWSTAGAGGEADAGAQDIGLISLDSVLAVGTDVTITLDPLAVQNMRFDNYFGVKLQMDTENNDNYQFYSSDDATSTNRPKLVIEYYPDTPIPPEVDWQCYEGQIGVEQWDCYELEPFVSVNPYQESGREYWGGGPTGWGKELTGVIMGCEPYPLCKNDFDIYYRVVYHYHWNTTGGALNTAFDGYIKARHPYMTDYLMASLGQCGETNSTGADCEGVIDGVFPAELISPYSNPLDFSILAGWYHTNSNAIWYANQWIDYEVYLSLEPFYGSCADTWFVPVPETFVVNPTVETPGGYPTDEQLYSTVIDAEYMVRVKDGPWNDGTGARTDAAFSVDGVFWHSWDEVELYLNVICMDVDPVNEDYNVVYFTATHDEFYIRVDDTTGNFADNTNDAETPYSYVIGVAFANPEAVACESQFSYDPVNDLFASVTVDATDDGVPVVPENIFTRGDWYAIKVVDGTWNENGGLARIDMEYQFSEPKTEGLLHGYNYYPTDYTDLEDGAEHVHCESSDGVTVFVQAPASYLYLRANDQDTPYNFADNSGALDVEIYHASYDRIESGCELQFERGALLDHYEVGGGQSSGTTFASYPTELNLIYFNGSPLISIPTGQDYLVPGGWYAIETVGGPWYTTLTGDGRIAYQAYYDMEIKVGSGDWEPFETWADATCIVETDPLGHLLVYFQVPDDTSMADDTYSLRVDSDSFLTSKGYMAWDLYGAMDFGYVGDTGSCDDYKYDPNAAHHIGQVNADAAGGSYINGLEVGSFFAIQIESEDTGSGWFDYDGAPESDALQLTTDGTNFQDLPNASGVLCYFYTPVSDELVIFVRPQNGQSFKLRADSTYFTDNTGVEYYTVYQATASDSLRTWDSCISDHVAYIPPINPHEWIDVTKAEGELIASEAQYAEYNGLLAVDSELPPEIWKDSDALGYYILEVEYGTGPWIDGETETPHYNVDLSNDGGVTWEELDSDTSIVQCSTVDPLRNYWKALIYVEQPTEVWKIRVSDGGTTSFADNTGNLGYILYTAGGFEVPPPDNSNIGAVNVQGGGDVCAMAPVIPEPLTLTEIDKLGNYFGGWIDYLNISIMRYMAFCPRHTDMFFSVFDLIKKKEPFATMLEFKQLEEDLKRELAAYGWSAQGEDFSFIWGTKTPGEIESLIDRYVFEGGSNDPWADGGTLLGDSFGEETPLPSSYATCQALLPDYKRFADGLCFSSAMMKETSAQFWIQFGFDIMMFFMVIGTIAGGVKDIIAMATGVARFNPSVNVNLTTDNRRRR